MKPSGKITLKVELFLESEGNSTTHTLAEKGRQSKCTGWHVDNKVLSPPEVSLEEAVQNCFKKYKNSFPGCFRKFAGKCPLNNGIYGRYRRLPLMTAIVSSI